MAHRALTLKYRPQVFADMIGQEHVSAVLSRALEGGRVAHAYLFTGARGVGKTTCARILAKSLNCLKRADGSHPGSDPCNTCTSCTEITAGVSLDVAEIDGASNRGIADVQALREKVRFAPVGGHYRVVIIDEVHQLSNDAFAALLKTLEEPPAHLVFIFATTDPQKLPDTIRSRCQRFDFARVPLKRVAERLFEIAKREAADPEGMRFTLSEGAAYLIAHKSEGSMRDAVSALDQVISAGESELTEELVRRVLGLADREIFFTLAGAIVAGDPRAALRALHEGFDKGLDARDLADGLSEHVRHILLLKVDPEGGDLVAASREDLARLASQGEDWLQDDLLRLLKIASDVSWPMRDSPQPLVHLEAAVVQMATLEKGETFGELIARLEALEKRLGGAAPATSGARGAAPATSGARGATPAAGGARGGAGSTAGGMRAGPGPAPAQTYRAAPAAAGPAPAYRAAPPATPPLRPQASAPAPAMRAAPPAAAPAPASAAAAPRTAQASAAPALAEIERDERVEGLWRATVVAVSGRKRLLGAFLEESRFVGLSGDSLVLAMDDLHRAVVEEKENLALLAGEALAAFGRSLTLACVPVAEAPEAPTMARPDDVEPLIDRAIEYFQGDVLGQPRAERTEG